MKDPTDWHKVLEVAASVKGPWAFGAVVVALISLVASVAYFRGKTRKNTVIALSVVVAAFGIVPFAAAGYMEKLRLSDQVNLRVSIDATGRESPRAWTDLPSESKETEHGWEITISRHAIGSKGVVTVFAEDKQKCWHGRASVTIGDDQIISVPLTLEPPQTQTSGIVVEEKHGKALGGAAIFIRQAPVATADSETGMFRVTTTSCRGEPLPLEVRAAGFKLKSVSVEAGSANNRIELLK
jgi:hypothetical protein